MRDIYETKLIYHLKSLREAIIYLLLIPVVFFLIMWTKNEKIEFAGLLFAVIPLFIILAPAIYLHLNYYIKNFGLKITVDETIDHISFSQNGKEYIDKISNIHMVEHHMGIYHRNKIDHAARKYVSWTPYNYLLIRFDNGTQYYITCLMTDILKTPFPVTHSFFRFIPYLKKGIDISDQRKDAQEQYENRISHYKSTFKFHHKVQLEEKIRNEKTYDKAAVEAARQLLKTYDEIK